MKNLVPIRLISVGLASLAVQAHAHEGHGIAGASHWHATDTFGLIALAAVVALVVWFTRGGK